MSLAESVPRAVSVEQAKGQLSRHGISILENVLDAAAIARVKDALARGIDRDRQVGTPLNGFVFDPDTRNTRVFDLVGKDRVFRDLVEHPAALELTHHLLGEDVLLSNFSANVTAPGSGAMGMHADQGYIPAPWPPYAFAINIAWAIDDFTVENGATRFVPDSVHKDHGPDFESTYETVPLTCKAGSIFAMDGRVWHQTGPNTSADQTRIGLFAYYVRPFIRPQWNWQQTATRALLADCSPRLRAMLGFGANVTSGLDHLYQRDDERLETAHA
ncbi:phytanoyl-CoA dioxygenase family protein [Zavarzinia sp. CC-PAN008]|uniref:phytanoyl-CoA dioxygenase family protein n=1 Tax=Zavarzinia sp. CC-PAN008 TaxID=3243332 RepID=UPI003F7462DE